MNFLNYHSCATCHGLGSKKLFQGLLDGHNLLKSEDGKDFFHLENRDSAKSFEQNIIDTFSLFTSELKERFSPIQGQNWGLILASTKGVIEDKIWEEKLPSDFDPYSPLLHAFKKLLPFSFVEQACLSNACASSHGAIELAQAWQKRKWVDQTLIVAVDLIGPFIYTGFSSLRAISEKKVCRPFDQTRDGLLLGDAMGVAVVGEKFYSDALIIDPVYNLCEGFSVTRPDTTGETLATCLKQSLENTNPEVMIAHGTATHYNDLTEANAITLSFKEQTPPFITASKWSVGHSLGASGLVDLNMAAEIITQQKVSAIATLGESDLSVSEYLVRENKNIPVNSVLISSLGFGGISSSLILKKDELS